VDDLKTGNNLKNVTEGMHQVIVNLRLNNNYALALASFNLTVPVTSNSS
jgi:hypothetical protein